MNVKIALLLEDEETQAFLITQLLKRMGYATLHFSEAGKALEVFHENQMIPSLVISDTQLPDNERGGWILLEQVRTKRPDVPFVLSSGRITEEGIQVAAINKAAFLSKPYIRADFEAAVREAIQLVSESSTEIDTGS